MKAPNIVLIFADDLGYGDLGCYGSQANHTPCLDRMAAEGARFTDFYSASPLCSPSRAALMTGCYPMRVGLDKACAGRTVLYPGDPIGLHPQETTIADVLKQAGYATALIGKWHLGDQEPFLPTRHGFDHYFGLPYSNDMHPTSVNNARRHFPPLPLMRQEGVCEVDPNQFTLTDRYLAESLDFARAQAEAGRPFFLCLSHMYVHLPLYVPQRFMGLCQDRPYAAAVEHLDATTGVILDALAELGIDDNTLVVFTSDNGSNGLNGGSNAPLRGFKGSTWEGGMREPCIMRWPGRVPAGSTCRALTTMMDLLPTFASLAGAARPADRTIDGHDLTALLADPPNAASPYERFAYYAPRRGLAAVRAGRWKLHFPEGALYNLDADIGEQHDVHEDHADVVGKLTDLADGVRADLGDEATGVAGAGCR
jgi:arylsulfatase A-like enzyme